MDDLEGLLDDVDCLGLLTCVAAVEHEGSSKTLDDWAEGLSELLALVSTSCVGHINLSPRGSDSDVVLEAGINDLNIIIGPSAE